LAGSANALTNAVTDRRRLCFICCHRLSLPSISLGEAAFDAKSEWRLVVLPASPNTESVRPVCERSGFRRFSQHLECHCA
jgi:hypothetical protein